MSFCGAFLSLLSADAAMLSDGQLKCTICMRFKYVLHIWLLFHFPFTHAIWITFWTTHYTIAWRCGNQILFSNEKDIIMEGCYVALLTAQPIWEAIWKVLFFQRIDTKIFINWRINYDFQKFQKNLSLKINTTTTTTTR